MPNTFATSSTATSLTVLCIRFSSMFVTRPLAFSTTRPSPTWFPAVDRWSREVSATGRQEKNPPASSPWWSEALRVSKQVLTGIVFFFLLIVAGWAQDTIRVGAFPNVTHAQAMVGKANSFFDKAMGPNVKVQWTSFNAGPAAIE